MLKVLRAQFFNKITLLTLVNCTTLTDLFYEEIFDQKRYRVKLVLNGKSDTSLEKITWNKELCELGKSLKA